MRCLPKTEKTRSTPRHSAGRGLGEGGVVTAVNVVGIVDTEAVPDFSFVFVVVADDIVEGGEGGDVVFVEDDDDKGDDDCDENDVLGNSDVVVCNDGGK